MKFNQFQHIPTADESGWSLLRAGERQMLPCRIPFELCREDVDPAIQGYTMGEFADARRFIELRRLSSEASDPQQWQFRLVECMLHLEQGNAEAAWKNLQLGLTWQACQESSLGNTSTALRLTVRDYLVMAAVALANNRTEAAETYASKAIEIIENDSHCCISDVLQDTRADAMLVFAMIRMKQNRRGEAETLLQYAHDAHVQAGDLEQMVVGLVVQAEIELRNQRFSSAGTCLQEAQRIVATKCDSNRHLRQPHLAKVIREQLHAARRLAAGTIRGDASHN